MKKQMIYEEPTVQLYEVAVEAGFSVTGGGSSDWGDGRPGGDFDENEYDDEL